MLETNPSVAPVVKRQGGFSLIELLLAMALFSFALLVISIGFLALFRIYQSGINDRRTQLNARQAIDQIVEAARGAQGFNDVTTLNAGVLCLDGTGKMYYVSGTALVEANWDSSQTCDATHGTSPLAITTNEVQVAALNVEQYDDLNPATGQPLLCNNLALCQLDTVRVDVRVTINKNDLDSSGNCKPAAAAFSCSVTPISTTITSRGGLL